MQFLYGDKQRRKCTTKFDSLKYNAGEPTRLPQEIDDKPRKRIRLPEPYNISQALLEQRSQGETQAKVTQSALLCSIKEQRTSVFFYARPEATANGHIYTS